jgi:hypothetical protein
MAALRPLLAARAARMHRQSVSVDSRAAKIATDQSGDVICMESTP